MEKARKEKIESLRRYCEAAVLNPQWEPKGGKTFCNIATNWIASELGCTSLKGLLANAIVAHMMGSKTFERVDAVLANQYANEGCLVIAGKQYEVKGHVAVVYPGPLVYSASWKKQIPMVANIGTKNGVMPSSHAFPVKQGEPGYYLWTPSKEL